jgi:hypothetical protein
MEKRGASIAYPWGIDGEPANIGCEAISIGYQTMAHRRRCVWVATINKNKMNKLTKG